MDPSTESPVRLLILDIDGLRRDVFFRALADQAVPNLSQLVGGPEAHWGWHFEPVSTAPSITFCCQSSIFTGAHPETHGVMGNQFFDRFGTHSRGTPRHYAFDVGDALAVDDAVRVFTGERGLANETLSASVKTLYELAGEQGLESLVAYNMIARGATQWIRPELADIARFTKGGGLLGISSEQYDGEMMDKVVAHLRLNAARRARQPEVLTCYFMGLDHHSHEHGPDHQYEYLTRVVDQQVGRLWRELETHALQAGTLVVVLSDHGQIGVIPDDRHSLRLSFPFDREMGYLFDALKLDVHDLPGEDPNCDAVVASNGGLAHVYLQNRRGRWADPPRFTDDVLPVARAFWEANTTGRYAADLHQALACILVRNVEQEGWEADYQVYTSDHLAAVGDFLPHHPEIKMVEAVNRLRHLASPVSGDLVLISNYADGFYFGAPITGVHGGLHPDDSEAVLSWGWPTATTAQIMRLREAACGVVADRCRAEGQRRAGIVDMFPMASTLMGWA